ncbi:MAG: hypothetical protein U5R30_15280 [Deltaproteobacteria bacterium]|nr:hypothetical protein [Deltaproteobacteria bacterium]
MGEDAGWETAEFAGRLVKEVPFLGFSMFVDWVTSGFINPIGPGTIVQISNSTRKVAGIESPNEFLLLNTIIQGTGLSMNWIQFQHITFQA